jgi:hypothetical protein
MQATVPPSVTEGVEQAPPDIETMRVTAQRVLGPDDGADVLPPAGEELATLTAMLRGHLEVLAPEVERAARKLKEGSIPRYRALGCVWEARSRLEVKPSSRYGGDVGHARRLARVLDVLCDHYENLSAAGEPRDQAAFVRLANHCVTCPTCRAMDATGANLNLPCPEGDRLNDEYRQAQPGRR